MPVLIFLGLLLLGFFLMKIGNGISKPIVVLGIFSVILGITALFFTLSMEGKIRDRGTFVVSKETVEYELVSLQADTEISGSGTRSYVEISEKTVFHFYYKTTKNGKNGFSPKTITSSDVFIDETYEGAPLIREIFTTYDYRYTKFEKWWLQDYITGLDPYTKVSYEIYVPAGSIVESYKFTK
ncbi:MAG: hypothetical protein IJX99_02585 [Clostridia bacterium]|nr:hypothetical protein [Clostridia bacterium]